MVPTLPFITFRADSFATSWIQPLSPALSSNCHGSQGWIGILHRQKPPRWTLDLRFIHYSNADREKKEKALDFSRAFFLNLAEREGFEPSIRGYRIHAFQACSFNHSDTAPDCFITPWGRIRRAILPKPAAHRNDRFGSAGSTLVRRGQSRQAGSNTAMDSICAVCGNMSITPAATNR